MWEKYFFFVIEYILLFVFECCCVSEVDEVLGIFVMNCFEWLGMSERMLLSFNLSIWFWERIFLLDFLLKVLLIFFFRGDVGFDLVFGGEVLVFMFLLLGLINEVYLYGVFVVFLILLIRIFVCFIILIFWLV